MVTHWSRANSCLRKFALKILIENKKYQPFLVSAHDETKYLSSKVFQPGTWLNFYLTKNIFPRILYRGISGSAFFGTALSEKRDNIFKVGFQGPISAHKAIRMTDESLRALNLGLILFSIFNPQKPSK